MEKKNINLELVRVKGETFFSFTVDPYITELYKKQSSEIKTSANWNGLNFYTVPSLLTSTAYKNLLANYGLFDDYGQPIVKNDGSSYSGYKLNIAWIRTTAGSGKIPVADTLTVAELTKLLRNCSSFLKEHFAEFFRDATIKGVVSIEL